MASSVSGSNGQRVFLTQLDVIERIIASIARRHILEPDERDDFASWVRFKLIENDYAILRKFQGLSSMATYLTVVITNLHRDYRIQKWGRWRPSSAARRLGERAIVLETLLYRDGYSLAQATEVLRSRLDPQIDPREISRLAAQLPARVRARSGPAESTDLENIPAPQKSDAGLLIDEMEAERDDAREALDRALATLPPEDQLILRLRYWDGVTIVSIARTLGLEQKPLYRRIEQLLSRLRAELEAQGIGRDALENFFSVGLS